MMVTAQATLHVHQVDSPLGTILIAGDEDAVHAIEFVDSGDEERLRDSLARQRDAALVPGATVAVEQMERELDAYFAGRLRGFESPMAIAGNTLREQVWRALLEIPYGETCSYGEIARRVGRPSAVRAVAQAIGANPLCIVVPCHRVVGADGSLTGYAGGLWRKRVLLDMELRNAFMKR